MIHPLMDVLMDPSQPSIPFTPEDGHGKAGGDGEGTASKAKKTKEVQLVDFSEEGEDVSTEILFTKSTATMNLPRSQLKSLGKHLLPEDLHFTTKDFFSLFLKQTVMVRRVEGGGGEEGRGLCTSSTHSWDFLRCHDPGHLSWKEMGG